MRKLYALLLAILFCGSVQAQIKDYSIFCLLYTSDAADDDGYV